MTVYFNVKLRLFILCFFVSIVVLWDFVFFCSHFCIHFEEDVTGQKKLFEHKFEMLLYQMKLMKIVHVKSLHPLYFISLLNLMYWSSDFFTNRIFCFCSIFRRNVLPKKNSFLLIIIFIFIFWHPQHQICVVVIWGQHLYPEAAVLSPTSILATRGSETNNCIP